MRRLFVLLGAVVLAALAAWPATAQQGAGGKRVACGAKSIDLYFWPHGHPAVPKYGFPPYPPPHLEAYRGGSVANSAELAVVTATSSGFAKSCRTVAAGAPTKWGGGPSKVIGQTRKVHCTFPQKAELLSFTVAGGQQLVVTRGHSAKIVVNLAIKNAGSVLQYDGRYCKASKVPGVS